MPVTRFRLVVRSSNHSMSCPSRADRYAAGRRRASARQLGGGIGVHTEDLRWHRRHRSKIARVIWTSMLGLMQSAARAPPSSRKAFSGEMRRVR